jgi:hypothetical protein
MTAPSTIAEFSFARYALLVERCREAGVALYDDAGVAEHLQRVLVASDFAFESFRRLFGRAIDAAAWGSLLAGSQAGRRRHRPRTARRRAQRRPRERPALRASGGSAAPVWRDVNVRDAWSNRPWPAQPRWPNAASTWRSATPNGR